MAPYINWIYFYHAWGFPPKFAAVDIFSHCYSCMTNWIHSFPEEEQAKANWGNTPEYKEFEQKSVGRTAEDYSSLAMGLMNIFREFGKLREFQPSDGKVQQLVGKLQDYITENFYTCSDEILLSLSKMYSGGGSMQRNIDQASGEGTAEFVTHAIEYYCDDKRQ